MRDPPATPLQNEASNGGADPRPDDDISSLRAILVGPEQRRMEELQARLDDPVRRAEDVGAVLPRVLVQHAQDPGFTRALTPTIERAITSSVQRDPRPLADALFPVMGPAIRKAVSAALEGMIDSFNRTLDLSLSPRSIRWRIEALRTGKTFAEIVLLKTILYRVEQVFLIHRSTGLLLQHVQAEAGGARDADMVSGMLTAIRDFAKDSFVVSDHESLESLEVGDLNVWIEPGPHALLAAVIRGNAPREYRLVLQNAIEAIHLQLGEALATFGGDASTLEAARPILESCLHTRLQAEAQAPRPRAGRLVLVAGVAALLVWLGLSLRDTLRWRRYLEVLRAQPGLAVVSAERSGGRFVVTGLRDPLAADPAPLLAAAGLSSEDVVGRWTPYHALDPEIVLARATDVLRPPQGVRLTLTDGVLSSSGAAPVEWITEAGRMAPFVAGIRRFDAAGAVDAELRSAIEALQRQVVLFAKGGFTPAAGQESAMQRVIEQVGRLGTLADVAGVAFRVEIVGHTDEDGLSEANLPLSQARAEAVRRALTPVTPAVLELVASGVGSTQPAVQGRTEADKQQNRRVSIRVAPAG
jgi:OOP family OmpA-OmpF porin